MKIGFGNFGGTIIEVLRDLERAIVDADLEQLIEVTLAGKKPEGEDDFLVESWLEELEERFKREAF